MTYAWTAYRRVAGRIVLWQAGGASAVESQKEKLELFLLTAGILHDLHDLKNWLEVYAINPRIRFIKKSIRPTAVFIYIEKIERQIFSIPIPPLFVSTRFPRPWLRIQDSQPR